MQMEGGFWRKWRNRIAIAALFMQLSAPGTLFIQGAHMTTAFRYLPFLMLAVSHAQAAAVTNLSDHAQQVTITEAGGSARQVMLQANETFRLPGKFWLGFAGREMRLEPYEEYAIWSDTVFGPQRRSSQGWVNP